jgi:hypothetical protein
MVNVLPVMMKVKTLRGACGKQANKEATDSEGFPAR